MYLLPRAAIFRACLSSCWSPVFMPDVSGHVSASILRLEASSELHRRISLSSSQRILLFCSCTVPCKKEKRGSFSPPSQGRRPKRISLSFSFSFSVFWSFLGRFLKPCFVTFDGFQKPGNPNFFRENGDEFFIFVLLICLIDTVNCLTMGKSFIFQLFNQAATGKGHHLQVILCHIIGLLVPVRAAMLDCVFGF